MFITVTEFLTNSSTIIKLVTSDMPLHASRLRKFQIQISNCLWQ